MGSVAVTSHERRMARILFITRLQFIMILVFFGRDIGSQADTCPGNLHWFTVDGHLYAVFSETTTVDTARVCCSSIGQHVRLAAFTSSENLANIMTYIGNEYPDEYWVDAWRSEMYFGNSGQFIWADGSTVDTNLWAPPWEPGASDDCARIKRDDALLYGRPCDTGEHYGVLCQGYNPADECDTDVSWASVEGVLYGATADLTSYSTAVYCCESFGPEFRLAIFDDVTNSVPSLDVFDNCCHRELWVDAACTILEDETCVEFRWSNGVLVNENLWRGGDPDRKDTIVTTKTGLSRLQSRKLERGPFTALCQQQSAYYAATSLSTVSTSSSTGATFTSTGAISASATAGFTSAADLTSSSETVQFVTTPTIGSTTTRELADSTTISRTGSAKASTTESSAAPGTSDATFTSTTAGSSTLFTSADPATTLTIDPTTTPTAATSSGQPIAVSESASTANLSSSEDLSGTSEEHYTTAPSTLISTHTSSQQTAEAPTNSSSSSCTCPCETQTSSSAVSDENLQNIVASIQQELTVSKAELSKTTRQKTSAYDHRPTVQAIGVTGVVLVAAPLVVILLMDLVRLLAMPPVKVGVVVKTNNV